MHITDSKQQTITIDNVDSTSYVLKDLVPGATYQVQAFTVFENKESAAYTSRNFTTSKYKLLAVKKYYISSNRQSLLDDFVFQNNLLSWQTNTCFNDNLIIFMRRNNLLEVQILNLPTP